MLKNIRWFYLIASAFLIICPFLFFKKADLISDILQSILIAILLFLVRKHPIKETIINFSIALFLMFIGYYSFVGGSLIEENSQCKDDCNSLQEASISPVKETPDQWPK